MQPRQEPPRFQPANVEVIVETIPSVTDAFWVLTREREAAPYTYKRLEPGHNILIDDESGETFGHFFIPGMVHRHKIRLHLKGRFATLDE